MKKLQSQSGETLVESLCAILVITLVFVFLCGAIISAARSNKQVADSNQSFTYTYQDEKGTRPNITVSDGINTETYPVHSYTVTPEEQTQGYASAEYRYYTMEGAKRK